MPNNLAMSTPAYAAGKFSTALSTGSGSTSVYPTATTFTFECWFKTTYTGGNQVIFSVDVDFIGLDGTGKLIGRGSPASGGVAYNDGILHHYALCGDGANLRTFVDGALVNTVATAFAFGASKTLTIGTHQAFGYAWNGIIDEFAIFSTARYTAAFTPPTAAYAGTETGLISLYHFDGTGTDSLVGNNALTGNAAKLAVSPGNCNVDANTWKTINSGAYFRTVFGGTACTLQFDTTGLATGFPKLEYRVDGTGPWTTVDLAASVVIAMPSESSAYASHLLEVNVRATTRTSRWALGGLVSLTGIILDAGKVLSKPGQRPLTGYVMGDSITEGLKALSVSEDTVNSSNGMQSYATYLGAALGAEIGVIGFSAQGFGATGDGGVPVFGSTYNLIYAGVTRTFSPAPDFIVINQGTNDSTNNIISAATTVINGLLAATPTTTKIVVLRPFNGNQAANLQAAIAACSTPTRVTYVDTTGFFASANSSDGIHPYGWEHISHIGPVVASAVRNALLAAPTLTARTVTLTLNDRAGSPRANLSGLKWAFFDAITPNLVVAPASQGSAATTNASGVLTLPVQTTLAPGATGWLVLSDSAGNAATASNAFSGPVTVA